MPTVIRDSPYFPTFRLCMLALDSRLGTPIYVDVISVPNQLDIFTEYFAIGFLTLTKLLVLDNVIMHSFYQSKHFDPLLGHLILPYRRQENGRCRPGFHGSIPRFEAEQKFGKVQSVLWRLFLVAHTVRL